MFRLVLALGAVALAQDTTSTSVSSGSRSTLGTSTTPGTVTISSSSSSGSSSPHLPMFSDSAPGGNQEDGSQHQSNDHDSLINYYFIFLALILCLAGLVAFFIFKRKRKALIHSSFSRQHALARDVNGWGNPGDNTNSWGGRRYWSGGRWRNTEDMDRMEGLNEHGEAPPPYIPKTDEEGVASGASRGGGPAIPLQTLNRDQAGLTQKPPDYTLTEVRSANAASGGGDPGNSRARQQEPSDTEQHAPEDQRR